jgi:hypothetical protein
MFGKIVALLFFIGLFLLGMLNIYRGLIDTNNMTKVAGVVLRKENVHWRGSRSSHYSAVFK